MTAMDIGGAVQAIRSGQRVARKGWNGRGMFLFFSPRAYVDAAKPFEPVMHEHVLMKTADNFYVPWLCSQTDLLATDWEVLP